MVFTFYMCIARIDANICSLPQHYMFSEMRYVHLHQIKSLFIIGLNKKILNK